jgi:hypothetical protein
MFSAALWATVAWSPISGPPWHQGRLRAALVHLATARAPSPKAQGGLFR